jgi:hypothetical protein
MTQIEDNKPTPAQETAQEQAEQTQEQTEQTSAPPANGMPTAPEAQDAPAAPPTDKTGEETGAATDEQPDAPAIPATQQTILEQPEAVPPAASELAPQEQTEDVAEIPHLPDPSIWPIVIAFGISILVVGIILGLGVMLLGLLIFVGGVAGWIYQDIQIAKRGEHH